MDFSPYSSASCSSFSFSSSASLDCARGSEGKDSSLEISSSLNEGPDLWSCRQDSSRRTLPFVFASTSHTFAVSGASSPSSSSLSCSSPSSSLSSSSFPSSSLSSSSSPPSCLSSSFASFCPSPRCVSAPWWPASRERVLAPRRREGGAGGLSGCLLASSGEGAGAAALPVPLFASQLPHSAKSVGSGASTTVSLSPLRSSSSPSLFSEDDACGCAEAAAAPRAGMRRGGEEKGPRISEACPESEETARVDEEGLPGSARLPRVSDGCRRRWRLFQKGESALEAESERRASVQRLGETEEQRVARSAAAWPDSWGATGGSEDPSATRFTTSFLQDSVRLFADFAETWKLIAPSVGCACLYLVVSPLLTFCNKLLYLPSLSSSPVTCTMLQQVVVVLAVGAARCMYTWGCHRASAGEAADPLLRAGGWREAADADRDSPPLGSHSFAILAKALEQASCLAHGESEQNQAESERTGRPNAKGHPHHASFQEREMSLPSRGSTERLDLTTSTRAGGSENRRGERGEKLPRGFVLGSSSRSLEQSRSPDKPVSPLAGCLRVLEGVSAASGPCFRAAKSQWGQLVKRVSSVLVFSQETFQTLAPVALPYTLMLACSNMCLYTSSLSGYHVARCSSIPLQLFLDVLGVDVCLSRVSEVQRKNEEASAAKAALPGSPPDTLQAGPKRVEGDGGCAPAKASQTVSSVYKEAPDMLVSPPRPRHSATSLPAVERQFLKLSPPAVSPRGLTGQRKAVAGEDGDGHAVRASARDRERTITTETEGQPGLRAGLFFLLLCFSPFFSETSRRHVASPRRLQARLQELGVSRHRLAACTLISVGVFCLAVEGQKLAVSGALMGLGASLFGALYMQLSSHLLRLGRSREAARTAGFCAEAERNEKPRELPAETTDEPGCHILSDSESDEESSGRTKEERLDERSAESTKETKEKSLSHGQRWARKPFVAPVWRESVCTPQVKDPREEPSRRLAVNDVSARRETTRRSLETEMAMHTAAAAAVILLPLSVVEQLCLCALSERPDATSFWAWRRLGTLAALLLCSGLLAALMPLTSYICFRHLSPLSCCVVGFFKNSVQLLVCPLLRGETPPTRIARFSATLCLLGCGLYALDSCLTMRQRVAKGTRKAGGGGQ
ncbi:putative transmembrane protein [Toxoplasma gondii TgCatPRC2]|uniref:Putative transmembrane protein n=1 Tax=Toxoplasma gondii TgCatPRC2 TaxID=1130821 RepID=A0A151H6X0_TOXGO|nr:putative transmembrane protein [Toxoplasma gondii TgCatPRC2]